MDKKQVAKGLDLLKSEFGEQRVRAAIEGVKGFKVEVPSWIFGAFGGGRFGEYTPPGNARNILEKLDDAAYINKLTGATDRVAMHILWDMTEDGFSGSYRPQRSSRRKPKRGA